MKTVRKLTAIFLTLAFLCLPVHCFAASATPPRVSLVIHDAVMVNNSLYGSISIYAPNGMSEKLIIFDEYFVISGTGKAEISDISELRTNNGMTYTADFKLTATYPGEIRLSFAGNVIPDGAGLYNTGSVPKYIDIKIFANEEGKADEKMTELEYFITVMIAPFWYLLHKIGLV